MSVRKREWVTAKGEAKSVWLVDYVDGAGTRRAKSFPRKKDADAFHLRARHEVRQGIHVADGATTTVAEAGRRWIETGVAAGLERTTLDSRRQHLNIHIAPLIGGKKLADVTVPLVRDWQDRLRASGRSPAMVRKVTTSFGGLLGDAMERGLVARNSVREMAARRGAGAREARKKARLQVGVDIPALAEIRAIVATAQEERFARWRPFFLVAIFTGLRASELRGLRWADVDLPDARLHVRQRADKYRKIGAPKSAAGQRTVPLPPIAANVLREWRLVCPRGSLDLVFPNTKGNIEEHPNIVQRGWHPLQISAGIVDAAGAAKYTGLHALRHWFASWCLNRRADGGLELSAKQVQSRLGHSTISMTMDTYGHLFPAADEADALAAAERTLLTAPVASKA